MGKIRDKLLREYKSSNASTTFLAYKKCRNRVINEIKSSKKNVLITTSMTTETI